MKLALVVCLVAAAAALERREFNPVVEPPLRYEMAPPAAPAPAPRQVATATVTMPIDHFDPQNSDTYQMRFMTNDEFATGDNPPIFIMVGGEWTISAAWLQVGNLYEMARENSGYLVYTEHRYYGASLPYADLTTENLRFLTVDQALADLAYYINQLKSSPRFSQSKVVLYGGSYAANMAIWFKQRYPQLVEGVIASSGPILGQVDFPEYLEVVDEAFRSEGGEACSNTIRQGILDTVAAMQTAAGRQTLEMAYRMCGPLNYDNRLDMGYFSGFITWAFSGLVQYTQPGAIRTVCDAFAINTFGITNMQKVAGFVNWYRGLSTNACWSGLTYEGLVSSYMANSESRAWYYQTCTEYGYYQTAPTTGTVFDPLTALDVDFYVDICQRIFDQSFDRAFVEASVNRVNAAFGGLNPVVNNTVNIHGTVDPWHRLGVIDRPLADSAPTYTVPRASHCFDMQPWISTDTIRMTNAKQAARRHAAEWLD